MLVVPCQNKTGTMDVVSRAPGKEAAEGKSQPLACDPCSRAQVTVEPAPEEEDVLPQESPTFLTRV